MIVPMMGSWFFILEIQKANQLSDTTTPLGPLCWARVLSGGVVCHRSVQPCDRLAVFDEADFDVGVFAARQRGADVAPVLLMPVVAIGEVFGVAVEDVVLFVFRPEAQFGEDRHDFGAATDARFVGLAASSDVIPRLGDAIR